MPNYDFKCSLCGNIIERNMSFDEAEEGFDCPACNGFMERQFSTGNIIGVNRFIEKPGMNAAQSRRRATESLEKRKHMKLNKG
ncbi:unnamed protein product, partial [marine sediment metagenome]